MFALTISYTQLPEVVAQHSESHGAWVKKYIDKGVFVCAGPKTSKLGGFILAKCNDKNTLMNILSEDSFVVSNVAEYQIVEFDCKVTALGLEQLKL